MKNILINTFALLMMMAVFTQSDVFAQAPNGFTFQAVGRNAEGDFLSNGAISVRFAIRSGSEGGPVAYRESHNLITDEYGHFQAVVGSGTVITGTFNQIPWSGTSHYLQVEYNDGSGFKDLGATQLLSVPYALHSNTAGFANQTAINVATEPRLTGSGSTQDPLDISRQGALLGQVMKWNGLSWAPGEDLNTDNQILTLNGNILSISGGNNVVLPAGTTYTAGPGINISGNLISNTGDLDPTNELQTINKSGNIVTLSQGGGSFIDEVNDADADPTNELQTISKVGNVITLSQGGGSFVDADDDPTNELQQLSRNGAVINLSQNGGNVDISDLGSKWSLAPGGIYYSGGKVGIGESAPDQSLVVGSNLGTVWDVPAATIGDGTGGALEIGYTDNRISILADDQNPFSRISASNELGEGKGDISLRARSVNIGENAQQSVYMLRVVHDFFGFLLENKTTAKNWEFYVNETLNGMDLYFDGQYKGTFDAITGGYFNVSDEKLKYDFQPLHSVLGNLQSLNTYRYYYNDAAPGSQPTIGVTAQDLQAVFPELVRKQALRDGEELLTVNYAAMSTLAIRAIQEQQEIIDQQEIQLKAQESMIQDILQRLEKLEKQ